jgi:hypothetical protein
MLIHNENVATHRFRNVETFSWTTASSLWSQKLSAKLGQFCLQATYYARTAIRTWESANPDGTAFRGETKQSTSPDVVARASLTQVMRGGLVLLGPKKAATTSQAAVKHLSYATSPAPAPCTTETMASV